MKKIFVFTILIVGAAILAACGGGAPVAGPSAGITTDLGGREVRIAVENAYPPYNSIDETTNEGVGWDYDVWREICARLNCEPVFVEAAWDGLFEALAAGEYDVAADGITLKLYRGAVVDFGDPYQVASQVVFVRSDEQDIDGPETLAAMDDKIVGVQLGTTNEAAAIGLVGEERVSSFDTFDLPVLALMSGDVDAVVIDSTAAGGFIDANPGKLKVVGDAIQSGEMFAFVFPPLSPLLVPVNWAQHEMFADGTLDEICIKWTKVVCDPSGEGF